MPRDPLKGYADMADNVRSSGRPHARHTDYHRLCGRLTLKAGLSKALSLIASAKAIPYHARGGAAEMEYEWNTNGI